MPDDDRTVHAWCASREAVRYDRSGKWYIEWPYERPRRRQVPLSEAVQLALSPAAVVYLDLPGGGAFDAKVRRELAAREASHAD
jgi:hypothetical protein